MRQHEGVFRSLRGAALIAMVGAIAAPVARADAAAERHGNIPEGLWVLNQQRSKELTPGNQTLWMVKDDGKNVVWVSVLTDAQHRVRVSSWDGAYDGDAVAVVGSGMMAKVTSNSPGTIHNFGEIPGVGPYSEDCKVLAGGKNFVCDGQVVAADGVKRWHDDFDWVAPSPVAR